MDFDSDNDAIVFHALRIFRNAFLAYTRDRLGPAFGDSLDAEIQSLFKKEWDEIERSATIAREAGFVSRAPIDSLDHLSVNHCPQLIEKYWTFLCPKPEPNSDTCKRIRSHLVALSRDLVGIRNPISHSPQEALSLRDTLRYLDSAARLLDVLELPEAEEVQKIWSGLVRQEGSDNISPPATLDTLPSREVITNDFIGRTNELADLWRWLGDDARKVWALVGDGGKGKTTIAYEFATQVRQSLAEYSLQGVLWLTAKQRRYIDGEIVSTHSADFFDLESALDWVLTALGWGEYQSLDPDEKLARCLELLREFPMLVVADDVDSIEKENERAVEFFALNVPQTGSKVLVTSRREVFGRGSCTTSVTGMTHEQVGELVHRRASEIGLDRSKISTRVLRQIAAATDGSPLYIEDLLRLAHFYSLDQAVDQWIGRRGDAAREYALK